MICSGSPSVSSFYLALARCIGEEVELDGAAGLGLAHRVIVALGWGGLGQETGVFRGSLYLFVDLFSRKIVGWQVFDCESAELASQLLQDICARQGIPPGRLVVHSDNGSPMKGETMLATMQRLGVAPSRSRPSVSNDNPYSESLFRTLKYRPELPVKPFENLLQARRWAIELVHWYNDEHRHSAIRFVTPSQRHAGQDKVLLKNRASVYELARQANPLRWSKQARDWRYIYRACAPQSRNTKNQGPCAPQKSCLNHPFNATTSLTTTETET